MTPRPHGIATRQSLKALGILFAGAGIVWIDQLMRPRWMAAMLGPICGHAGALALHCPACYAAAALIVAGVGLALGAPALTPNLLRASSGRDRR